MASLNYNSLEDAIERHRSAWTAWQAADDNDIAASKAEEDAIYALAVRPAANQAEFVAALAHILDRETRRNGGDPTPSDPYGLLAICVRNYIDALQRS
jgi:hypothetical protein